MKKIYEMDELLFFIVVSFAYFTLLTVVWFEVVSLWLTLIMILSLTLFYSLSIFSTRRPLVKLFYFTLTIPLQIGYFALIYKAFGIVDTSTGFHVKPGWLDAFYFSTVTWTTLGYGDFRPSDDVKIWAVTEAFLGYLLMGLFVGKVIHVFQSMAKK